MKIRDLDIVFSNANKILSNLQNEHTNLRATVVISVGYGKITKGMSVEAIIQEAASTIVPSKIRQECIYLSILLKEARRYSSDVESLELKKIIEHLRTAILTRSELLEVSEEALIVLALDDLDYQLIAQLKKHPLLKSSPIEKSSIVLSIGKIRDLRYLNQKGGT